MHPPSCSTAKHTHTIYIYCSKEAETHTHTVGAHTVSFQLPSLISMGGRCGMGGRRRGVAVPAAARVANNQLATPVIDAADGPKRKQQAWSDPVSSMLHKERGGGLRLALKELMLLLLRAARSLSGYSSSISAAIKAWQLCSGSSQAAAVAAALSLAMCCHIVVFRCSAYRRTEINQRFSRQINQNISNTTFKYQYQYHSNLIKKGPIPV